MKQERHSLSKETIRNPLYPDAKWHLPGLMEIEWISAWLDNLKTQYDYEPIGAVYGSPNVIWNCGRMVTDDLSRNLPFALERWRRSNTPVLFTFSNPLLNESEVANPVGNHILHMANDVLGSNAGVIVSSDHLRGWIRKQFPSMAIECSMLKTVMDHPDKRDADYYNSLMDSWDTAVIHVDDNLDLEMLAKIEQKDKYIILVNEPCVMNCPVRKGHVETTAEDILEHGGQIVKSKKYWPNNDNSVCFQKKYMSGEQGITRRCTLYDDEIKDLYDLGFRTFKLQGRGGGADLTSYTFIQLRERIFSEVARQSPELLYPVLMYEDHYPSIIHV